MFFPQLVRTNVADLLFTCSDDNIWWKLLFGSYIPKYLWFLSTVSTLVRGLKDWHTYYSNPCNHPCWSCAWAQPHARKIMRQKAAIQGYQTEMATKRQNVRTAALNKYIIQVFEVYLFLEFSLFIQQNVIYYCMSMQIGMDLFTLSLICSITYLFAR